MLFKDWQFHLQKKKKERKEGVGKRKEHSTPFKWQAVMGVGKEGRVNHLSTIVKKTSGKFSGVFLTELLGEKMSLFGKPQNLSHNLLPSFSMVSS